MALPHARAGNSAVTKQALRQARSRLADQADAHGLAWCDEVQAIALRRAGQPAASARLQAEIDRRDDFERDAMYRFVPHNSRAMTRKLLGDSDAALRHFYATRDAAARTGMAGPRITALNNLGGFHQDLYNLDDARRLSTQALDEARAAQAGAAEARHLAEQTLQRRREAHRVDQPYDLRNCTACWPTPANRPATTAPRWLSCARRMRCKSSWWAAARAPASSRWKSTTN